MKKDYEIANECKLKSILDVGKEIGLDDNDLELFGNYKAKVFGKEKKTQTSKLILVTSMNPTPYGEGKTTVAIGLDDALRKLGVNSILTLREPSLGPVFGIKGGACGGGYSQVVPMEDINLHFTGDFHAITSANNLVSAMIDNSLYQGNPLQLDKDEIYFTRTIDMNDRVLRNITIGGGARVNGVERKETFTITAASEIMSTLCMSSNLEELRENLDKIIIGKNLNHEFVFLKDLHITGSLLALLKDAMKPNLVQSLEGNPVFVHGGPFANIAPGVNSIAATKTALAMADVVVTEAGFGFDLGGFKFLDIVSRNHDLVVSGIVFVVTLKAIKYHANREDLSEVEKVKAGFANVQAHLDNLEMCGIPYVVTLNSYETDTKEEIQTLENLLGENELVINNVFQQGGDGAEELATKVLKLDNTNMNYLYPKDASIKEKIEVIARKLLHASDVYYSEVAEKKILEAESFSHLPICIAKTQYSISDDAKKLGYPKDYTITVRDIRVFNGAGFITVYLGNIMTMPGLSASPAATLIDVKDGVVTNIF